MMRLDRITEMLVRQNDLAFSLTDCSLDGKVKASMPGAQTVASSRRCSTLHPGSADR